MTNYVLIVSGQSNAVGRAPNPLADPDITSHTFSRVRIWIAGSGWEILDPADNTQSHDQAAGQHGLEPYLGYLFEQQFPSDNLYIIKFAEGGRGLDSSFTPNFSPTGTLYATLKNDYISPALVSSELSGGYTAWGFWWMQGETDSLNETTARSYYDNLVEFFNTLESDVAATGDFKRLIGMVRDNSTWTYRELLRDNQRKFASNQESSVLIYTDDISVIPTDTVHYSGQGFLELAPPVLRALRWNGDEADTHFAHKHRRIDSTTSSVSTRELTESKIFKDLGTGELLVDTRHREKSIYFVDDIGNVVKIGSDPGLSSLVEGTYNNIPAAGVNMAPNRNLTVLGGTLDSTIQLYTETSTTATNRGANLALFGSALGADAGLLQLWNWENADIRFATNGTERLRIPKDACGIEFVGSQVQVADSNTLDGYLESSFTATLTGSTGAPTTPVTTTGMITRIGRQILVNFWFGGVDTTGASGNMLVTGLPANASANGNNNRIVASALTYNVSYSGTNVMAFLAQGSTQLEFFSPTSGGAWSNVAIPSTTSVFVSVTIAYNII